MVGRFTMAWDFSQWARALAGAAFLAAAPAALAQHQLGVAFEAPKVVGASDEGQRAIRRFQLPPGWKCELWAAEPDLAQPVAMWLDDSGKVYVCETFRHSQGVDDIRGHQDWLDEELASKTADDRIALLKRHYHNDLTSYTAHTERIQLLEDTHGVGHADRSTVFAEGFTNVLDGIAAGVIARGRDVYVTCIPHLWLLRDTKGTGSADFRRSLSYGYGVRGGFLGHDLHGLTWGPDGKLYFSIGDRAATVFADGKWVGNPDTGGVFRCNPDGSGLELFCYGLRNPQDLTFDDYGNLFTGDNNSDGGDQARWMYLVEGSDNGWRVGYQFLERENAPVPRGPWNAERMWGAPNAAQPAFLIPAIENIASGPSGVSYYPGTGAPKDWEGTFTLVDFRGSSGGSGIHRFQLEPAGATFHLVKADKMIWSALATDGDWGPDSAFYLCDWVEGWNPNGKGRIYRMSNAEGQLDPAVAEAKKLLASDFSQRSTSELAELLFHPNHRVRQNAQFALADKGREASARLIKAARGGKTVKGRLNAIWALGQIQARDHRKGAPGTAEEMEALIPLLRDPEKEVRANAARVLGDAAYPRAYTALTQAMGDSDARVVSLATLAISKLGRPEAVPAAVEVLRRNTAADPVVRHAAVMALVRCGTAEDALPLADDPSDGVRLGAALALRRFHRDEIARFLRDSNPAIALEAARAINDETISGGMAELAALPVGAKTAEPLMRRVVNACYRNGVEESARRLVSLAALSSLPEYARLDALEALSAWPKNGGRDRITGLWRPTAFPRDAHIPGEALRKSINELLSQAPNAVRAAAARATAALRMTNASPALASLAADTGASGAARVAALKALVDLQAPEAGDAVAKAADDRDENVRKAAVELGPRVVRAKSAGGVDSGGGALARVEAALDHGSLSEKQSALAAAAALGAPGEAVLSVWVKKLQAGQVPLELQLDVVEAANKRPNLKSAIAQWEAAVPQGGENNIGPWRTCLVGGNADEGRKVFYERPEVSCLRCHKVKGEGGEVGPELTGVGQRHDRDYILQSIIFPNAVIATGFENVLVSLKNGTTYAGVVKAETADELTLNSPEDGILKLKKADITAREKGLSGMPEGFGTILSKMDLRNLVEFVASAR